MDARRIRTEGQNSQLECQIRVDSLRLSDDIIPMPLKCPDWNCLAVQSKHCLE